MPSFQCGNTTIDYFIEYRKNKKNVTITVDWVSGVKIIAPASIHPERLNRILHQKGPWILKKQHELNEIRKLSPPKEFSDGENFLYLGKNYRLKVIKRDSVPQATLKFWQGRFLATVPAHFSSRERKKQLSQLFKSWYMSRGEEKIQERLDLYCPKMELYPTKIVIKEQKRLWGSCTKKGTVNINWQIIMAPLHIVDYLIVHELAHLKHPNHSRDFWQTVQSVLPDYQQRREWLRKYGPTLNF